MIERTTDIDKINSVLKHDYIWPRVSDKGQSKDEFTPPLDDVHYLYEEGILIILHPDGDKWEGHINVLPEFRDNADSAMKEGLRYAFVDLGADEIVTSIPEKYGSVYGFAVKYLKDVGFADGEHLLSLRIEEWAQ